MGRQLVAVDLNIQSAEAVDEDVHGCSERRVSSLNVRCLPEAAVKPDTIVASAGFTMRTVGSPPASYTAW